MKRREKILSKLNNFIAQELVLSVTGAGVEAIRDGRRAVLADDHNGYTLGKYISGKLPEYYRTLDDIKEDVAAGVSLLEAVLAIVSPLPTAESFQNSHCGEIVAAHFVEEKLRYRRLYSKLTMTTSQNTNAHKMDGLFVDTMASPFEYLFVEAKSSILPTEKTKNKTHRSGILKDMLVSLDAYHTDDPRFELARIRDNLQKSFSASEGEQIRKDLIPPGPDNLKFLGISVTSAATVNVEDDDFMLSSNCSSEFSYYAIVVTDLANLAADAYGRWMQAKAALS